MKNAAPGLFIPDEAAMLQFAARMAECLPANAPFVLYLEGDLGSGKTTLARGMLHAMGHRGVVRSPTYGLITEYGTPQGHVLHLDLYRLRVPEELDALGLADYLADTQLWLVEWPEQAGGTRLPPADARVCLDVDRQGRRLQLSPASESGQQWGDCLVRDLV